jgi:hypothetical protein
MWPAGPHIEKLGTAVGGEYRVTIFEDPPQANAAAARRNHALQPTNVATGSSPIELARDGTMKLLLNFAARNQRVRILLANGKRPNERRTVRLGFCRNVLLHEALRMHSEVLVMLDLDCKATLEPPLLAQAVLGLASDRAIWHALSFNSLPNYYDFWALRSTALGVDYVR